MLPTVLASTFIRGSYAAPQAVDPERFYASPARGLRDALRVLGALGGVALYAGALVLAVP